MSNPANPHNYLPFKKARRLVRALKLKSRREWQVYIRSDGALNIPYHPDQHYKDRGWNGYIDFLGLSKTPRKNTPVRGRGAFCDYATAQAFAQDEGIQSSTHWYEYIANRSLPDHVPRHPHMYYRDKGWTSWPEFLGQYYRNYVDYDTCAAYAQAQGIQSLAKWRAHLRDNGLTKTYPLSPFRYYKTSGWLNSDVFFNKPPNNKGIRSLLPFEEARRYARTLGFKSMKEWDEYSKSGKRPSNIPGCPRITYKNEGWAGMPDFLGYGKKRLPKKPAGQAYAVKRYGSFKALRKHARSLNLKSRIEWMDYCHQHPGQYPVRVELTYKEHGFTNWYDFLGNTAPDARFVSYKAARARIKEFEITSTTQYRAMRKAGKLGDNLPSDPPDHYKDNGWVSWPHFLGKKGKYLRFKQARTKVRALNLATRFEFYKHMETTPIAAMPDNPDYMYKHSGWQDWPDFLGCK